MNEVFVNRIQKNFKIICAQSNEILLKKQLLLDGKTIDWTGLKLMIDTN